MNLLWSQMLTALMSNSLGGVLHPGAFIFLTTLLLLFRENPITWPFLWLLQRVRLYHSDQDGLASLDSDQGAPGVGMHGLNKKSHIYFPQQEVLFVLKNTAKPDCRSILVKRMQASSYTKISLIFKGKRIPQATH